MSFRISASSSSSSSSTGSGFPIKPASTSNAIDNYWGASPAATAEIREAKLKAEVRDLRQTVIRLQEEVSRANARVSEIESGTAQIRAAWVDLVSRERLRGERGLGSLDGAILGLLYHNRRNPQRPCELTLTYSDHSRYFVINDGNKMRSIAANTMGRIGFWLALEQYERIVSSLRIGLLPALTQDLRVDEPEWCSGDLFERGVHDG